MSIFSFIVLLPLNFTGGGRANASDLKGYVGSLLFTDFLRFTMANVSGGSPRLWVHCFAAYLLTGIVVRELLVEYEAFNSIRHRYLLSREPHLRTVLVTNIPRHLRTANKITNYFKHVYPEAVKSVIMCQNLQQLELLIRKRHALLSCIEKEVLILCRAEKRKLFAQSRLDTIKTSITTCSCLESLGLVDNKQEKLTRYYSKLEELNDQIEKEKKRRKRVMKKMDRMEAGEGRGDIDYILASPFVTDDPNQRKVMGLPAMEGSYRPPTIGAPRDAEGGIQSLNQPDTTALATIQEHHQAEGESGLRARSPVPDMNSSDGIMMDDSPDTSKKKKQKAFSKARGAIRRYSNLAREVNFFGRPVDMSFSPSEGKGSVEDHINEVTDKAFVVMRTFTASTIAIQSMHSSKPGAMNVVTAPEPRDILWHNIYVSKGALRTRFYIGELLVLLLIAFYVVPVALVSLLVSESALVSSSPRLAQLDDASAFFSTAIAMVQPLCIVGIQQLLPPLFLLIGKAEGVICFSEVQMRAFSRYFLFQVVNVFLVTTIAGSIFDTVAIIIENPEAAFEMLGNSLPRMSSFFITFVLIKTFLALGVEMVRTVALVQASLRYILFPNATLRTKRSVLLGMRAIDDPGWFPFHKILAQDMLVVVISVVFAVVAPLVLLPCALFCLFSRIIWTHHHMYIYESVFETGGQFWPKIFRRFVFGLIIAQMTITGQFILKEARHEAYATIALIFITYVFLRSTRARYDQASSTLPLEVATVMDIALSQEEEAIRAQEKQAKSSSDRESASVPDDFDDEPYEAHLGNRIGHLDPFKYAYLQPALRANPRAKPEQPFPPGQLGREEVLMGNAPSRSSLGGVGTENDYCHAGATVRLKSLNQQDRRLVNRWWNDQLQSCGEQNMLRILIGEESGTLMLGRTANLVELSNRGSIKEVV
jgi:hypothetical protein